MVDHVASPMGERPSVRDVADVRRDLRDVRLLPEDEPRRQAWLNRKRGSGSTVPTGGSSRH